MPTMNVNRQQLLSEIELWGAKIRMHESLIATSAAKGHWERELLRAAAPMLGIKSNLIDGWIKASKEWDQSNLDILKLQLAELKSGLVVRRAMLAEGDRKIIAPAGVDPV